MRSAFHEELDSIGMTLLQMAGLVKIAMVEATTALLASDLTMAEKVIAADSVIDDIQHELDARTINLMARQQPVASDLRTLVTSLRMSADLERMGDLAHHVAKQARMRYPNSAVPAELVPIITSMGMVSDKLIEKLTVVMEHRDTVRALEIETDDDEMDKLHRDLIEALLADDWTHGIETAIDMTLLGRYYERFADHVVSISRRVYFLVTGEYSSN
ncbi:MAG: phosphate transport system regulatory protein PhoU [Actinomycetales bacterium]|nr:MAG: phosphate transport system regulatory protein PhoU [Actinomycetales bacterium]